MFEIGCCIQLKAACDVIRVPQASLVGRVSSQIWGLRLDDGDGDGSEARQRREISGCLWE